MNEAQLDQAIAATPHEKVTKDGIDARIKKIDYMVLPNSTVTVCNITLENRFSVRGESACVDPRNFDMEIGRQIAYRDAFNKLWQLEGYLLAERRYGQQPAEQETAKGTMPTIGRVLHYYGAQDQAQPHAAIVTFVWHGTMVNLVAFDSNGNPCSKTSVTLVQPNHPKPDSEYAEWPRR